MKKKWKKINLNEKKRERKMKEDKEIKFIKSKRRYVSCLAQFQDQA